MKKYILILAAVLILSSFAPRSENNNNVPSPSPSTGQAPAWLQVPPTPAPSPTSAPTPTPGAPASAAPDGSAPAPTQSADPNQSSAPVTASPVPSPTIQPGYVKAGTPEAETVKVPILLYHHIADEFDLTNAISIISPRDFNLHMTAIKTQYKPISLREYVEFVNCKDGSKTLPTNPIIVTFDDGYLSNYEVAYPILKKLEIPATIFIVTDTVGEIGGKGKVNYSHITWEQAKEMQDSGLIDIESHTNDHIKLGETDIDTVNYELRKSKYLIEKKLGKTCDMIAYPYGSYTDEAIQASKKAGYNVQCLVGDDATNIDYEVNIPRDGVMNLTRITVSGTMGNVNVIELVRKAIANKNIDY